MPRSVALGPLSLAALRRSNDWGAYWEAADRGFGLVITTGGVGAEDKDFSVEALLAVDRGALTPYIVQFEQGTGRHVKDGVKIGVGKMGLTTIVALPGPHDEVVVAAESLLKYCQSGQPVDQAGLAGEIARVLREKLRHKWAGHHHNHLKTQHK